ncbi:MAG: hypothetical protein H6Q16_925, partial [Bacteroidetes bacterium]|nr:hypothetical protein [Bacteroidota bacterium]
LFCCKNSALWKQNKIFGKIIGVYFTQFGKKTACFCQNDGLKNAKRRRPQLCRGRLRGSWRPSTPPVDGLFLLFPRPTFTKNTASIFKIKKTSHKITFSQPPNKKPNKSSSFHLLSKQFNPIIKNITLNS